MRAFAGGDIDADNAALPPAARASARALLAEIGPECDVVLLGSIASPKYVDVLLEIFGDRLRFPIEFVGRGDMSRGGLLLRQASDGVELEYVPVPARRCTARGRRSFRRCNASAPERNCPLCTASCARNAADRLRSRAIRTTSILTVDGKDVRLTNLRKIFWPELGLTKGDLLQYYADVADVLLPHIRDRAMVMKRYPHGAAGEFFFMKRAPSPRPDWIEICAIEHGSGNVIDFPMIQDRAALLWVDQSRLHRSQPVVRALRRRRSARLPALRSRSRRRRDVRSRARDRRSSCARRSTR